LRHRLPIIMLAFLLSSPAPALAQGIQAARALDETPGLSPAMRRDILLEMGKDIACMDSLTAPRYEAEPAGAALLRSRSARLESLAFEAARERDDRAFIETIHAFELELTRVRTFVGEQRVAEECGTKERSFSARASTVPAIHAAVPDVVFVALGGASLGSGFGPALTVGLSTNLVGAAAATLLQALGTDPLAAYMKKNFAIGMSVPLTGSTRLAGEFGVGLGEMRGSRSTWWPALNLVQMDTSDARLPVNVIAVDSTRGSWSSLQFSVAWIPMNVERFRARVGCGKLVPVWTFGVAAPYYYPGDPASAVTAIFGERRSTYRRAGGARFSVGVAVPLHQVSAPREGTKQHPACKVAGLV
jgi:hypothetical protein